MAASFRLSDATRRSNLRVPAFEEGTIQLPGNNAESFSRINLADLSR
jgi:hypothetical protein